jgi:hypothetical protein
MAGSASPGEGVRRVLKLAILAYSREKLMPPLGSQLREHKNIRTTEPWSCGGPDNGIDALRTKTGDWFAVAAKILNASNSFTESGSPGIEKSLVSTNGEADKRRGRGWAFRQEQMIAQTYQ